MRMKRQDVGGRAMFRVDEGFCLSVAVGGDVPSAI